MAGRPHTRFLNFLWRGRRSSRSRFPLSGSPPPVEPEEDTSTDDGQATEDRADSNAGLVRGGETATAAAAAAAVVIAGGRGRSTSCGGSAAAGRRRRRAGVEVAGGDVEAGNLSVEGDGLNEGLETETIDVRRLSGKEVRYEKVRLTMSAQA